jgi:hypothetical protein
LSTYTLGRFNKHLAPTCLLHELLTPLGLQKIRSDRIIRLSAMYIADPPSFDEPRKSRVPHYPRTAVSHLPGCGRYALDSFRIFCCPDEWVNVMPSDKELIKYLVTFLLLEVSFYINDMRGIEMEVGHRRSSRVGPHPWGSGSRQRRFARFPQHPLFPRRVVSLATSIPLARQGLKIFQIVCHISTRSVHPVPFRLGPSLALTDRRIILITSRHISLACFHPWI